MKKLNLFLPFLFLLVISCTEWQEEQIHDEYIEVLVPRDSLRTTIATQLFYWYEISGAARYELQIVSPGFDRIDRLVLDTNISGTKHAVSLTPGTYQWSIRGYNNSSSTDYTVGTLFIDSTSDLSLQSLQLVKPGNQDTGNVMAKIFQWQSLYNADNYHFEIWKPAPGGELVLAKDTEKDSVHFTVAEEGNYTWRVRAENAVSQTEYSSRTFFADTGRPAAPVLLEPEAGIVLNSPTINFKWERPADNGSSLTDTFYLATDSNMTNLRRKIATRRTELSLDTVSTGIYYWSVRSGDKAGNIGKRSKVRQFTRQ